jgi:exosortase A-associated hydrolase 2
MAWLRDRVGGEVGLWGLRLGATLAADSARGPGVGVDRLVLWQPVASGEQFLTQFLRLHLASEMLTGGAAQTGVRELRETLARGTLLEIAGYDLHPDLASAIEGLKLGELAPAAKTVIWREVSASPEPRITPASQRVIDAWSAAGLEVRAAAVTGEPFWTTLEIAECAALLDATDASLADDVSHR